MVGLGFAMTENILYYGRAVERRPEDLKVVFILRGMASPFSHPLFTSMTGIGLGWARQSDSTLYEDLDAVPRLLSRGTDARHLEWIGCLWRGSRILCHLLPGHGPGVYHHFDGDSFSRCDARATSSSSFSIRITRQVFSTHTNSKGFARCVAAWACPGAPSGRTDFLHGARRCAVIKWPASWRSIAVAWRVESAAMRTTASQRETDYLSDFKGASAAVRAAPTREPLAEIINKKSFARSHMLAYTCAELAGTPRQLTDR